MHDDVMGKSQTSRGPLSQIQNVRQLSSHMQHPVSCFLLVSLAVPSIPFMLQSLVLPCLVLAGCLAEDSGASHCRTELC